MTATVARRPPTHGLLLTGRPGVGKTTLLTRVAGSLGERRIGGFYTEEIREGAERRGFRLVTFDGRQGIMAHVDVRGGDRVGRYGVDVSLVDELSASALAPNGAVDVYLVDEIGKMECLSRGFIAAMRDLLDSAKPVIATVGERGGGFIAEVKRRPDAELWRVTPDNRDTLPGRVRAWLDARMVGART